MTKMCMPVSIPDHTGQQQWGRGAPPSGTRPPLKRCQQTILFWRNYSVADAENSISKHLDPQMSTLRPSPTKQLTPTHQHSIITFNTMQDQPTRANMFLFHLVLQFHICNFIAYI